MPPRSKSATANAVPADFGHRKGAVIEFAVALKPSPFGGRWIFAEGKKTDEGLNALMWLN